MGASISRAVSAAHMSDHREFSSILLMGIFFLPAVLSLFFAWSVWIANKRPAIAMWRLDAFKWGLISASLTTAIFTSSSIQRLRTLEPAQGVWLGANWVGIVLWVISLGAALTGKGWGRIILVLWGVLIFLGVFGIDSAMIP
jgi:hypothetical protein